MAVCNFSYLVQLCQVGTVTYTGGGICATDYSVESAMGGVRGRGGLCRAWTARRERGAGGGSPQRAERTVVIPWADIAYSRQISPSG